MVHPRVRSVVLVGEPDSARVGGCRSHCLASSRYARPPPWEVGEHPGGLIVGLVLRIADRDSGVGRLYWPADVPTREGSLFGREGPAGRSTIRQRAALRQEDLTHEKNVFGINFYVDANTARPYTSLIDGEGRRDRPTTEPTMNTSTSIKTTCHRDGSITYWSVYRQQWVRRAEHISDSELAAMSFCERERVMRHLGM